MTQLSMAHFTFQNKIRFLSLNFLNTYMSKSEILQKMETQLDILHKEYFVDKIGLFGSYCRGEEQPESDIDILVKFSQPVGLSKFFRLEDFLEKLLHNHIDLVTIGALHKRIKSSILQEVVYV